MRLETTNCVEKPNEGLRTANFRLPGSSIAHTRRAPSPVVPSRRNPKNASTGPTNKKLRIHLPLLAPGGGLSRLRVGFETREACAGRALVFDDSFEHEAWNDRDYHGSDHGALQGWADGEPEAQRGYQGQIDGRGGPGRDEGRKGGGSADANGYRRDKGSERGNDGSKSDAKGPSRAGYGEEDVEKRRWAVGGGATGVVASYPAAATGEARVLPGCDDRADGKSGGGVGVDCPPLGADERGKRARSAPRVTLIADVWHPDLSSG